MEIKILGPGCRNCVALEKVTREAVEGLGIEADIDKVTDYAAIAAYGVMSTPGLVVDGQVVIAGRVPSAARVRALLSAHAG